MLLSSKSIALIQTGINRKLQYADYQHVAISSIFGDFSAKRVAGGKSGQNEGRLLGVSGGYGL